MALAVDATVVVATRNRAAQLSACLSSLLTQTTDARFEVIVVDNASDDTTPEVVRRHAESDPRIRRVEETVVGLSRAKNAGISNARGELLLFTDDDVVLVDRWIAAYVDFFRTPRPGPVLAGGPVLPIAHDLSPWPAWITASGTVELPRLYHGEVPRRLGEFEWLWGGNMAAPRRLFDAIGGFDESIGVSGEQRGTFEDVELVQRVAAHGGECWYLPAAAIYHRTAPEATRPRAVAANAFTRGANDVLRHRRGSHYEPSLRVPTKPLLAAIATPLTLAAWTVSAAAFRMTGGAPAFELARRWAWAAGWCTITATDTLTRARALAGRRLALLGRALALRLTPP